MPYQNYDETGRNSWTSRNNFPMERLKPKLSIYCGWKRQESGNPFEKLYCINWSKFESNHQDRISKVEYRFVQMDVGCWSGGGCILLQDRPIGLLRTLTFIDHIEESRKWRSVLVCWKTDACLISPYSTFRVKEIDMETFLCSENTWRRIITARG